MNHNFFIHLSVDGHLGCFHVLAVVHSAVMNTGVYVSFSNYGFLRVYASSETVESHGSFIPSFFKEPPYCSQYWLYQFAFPPTV